ncbi:hypothetical protein EYZ11_013582 [Aspergillus tanneri]|uniref:Uncharacterized protein n=1 Tax=Aspergillus tanneri TaxID=1220188 RepID=A0A4S3J2Q6_9EURO|nr:hypothetical protein EYZ11_013582 [Aspergillus tanneri]
MTLPDLNTEEQEPYDPGFTNGDREPYWHSARVACPSDGPSRNSDIASVDFANPQAKLPSIPPGCLLLVEPYGFVL